jgi:hypothetical protein
MNTSSRIVSTAVLALLAACSPESESSRSDQFQALSTRLSAGDQLTAADLELIDELAADPTLQTQPLTQADHAQIEAAFDRSAPAGAAWDSAIHYETEALRTNPAIDHLIDATLAAVGQDDVPAAAGVGSKQQELAVACLGPAAALCIGGTMDCRSKADDEQELCDFDCETIIDDEEEREECQRCCITTGSGARNDCWYCGLDDPTSEDFDGCFGLELN